ncbi:alpha-galactosidase [Streptacidiphilus sp. MAP12-16]|uniref:alpha-galactosidase n=1 Tax=Streptacidiphilus sp. MAP12-16 TaxID=3156300 RepID=UPI003519526A
MPAVSHSPSTRTWVLSTPATSYAVRVDDSGSPRHLHWGGPLTLDQAASLPLSGNQGHSSNEGRSPVGEELPVDGGERYGAPSLQVRFADGTRALEWAFDGHGVEEDPERRCTTLRLHFRDRYYPLRITLGYQVHGDSDVIERWTELTNTSAADGDASDGDASAANAVDLLRADSAAWSLPPRDDYRLSHTTGMWAAETQLHRTQIPYGETVLTSRRGTTSHHAQPWAMVDAGDADEQHGQVWSTALAWSGTWRITVQRTPDNLLGLTAGAGHDGILLRLAPGETHTTPRLAGLYSTAGFGGTSRSWHAHIRAHVLPHPDETRPVLYNSWEATGFAVTQEGQQRLAAHAAAAGAELFVMDDGWFGARRNDRAGLGDWTPHPGAFPDGLQPLVDEVHRLGMQFGLWVEPEMVNPDSDLYRAHPDWVLHYPHRQRTELRNQLVLNFARPDVAEWAYGWLTRLVGDHGIDYLKWDMNRPFTEAGWPELGGAPGAQDRLWTDYVRNYYGVLDRLRVDHPALRIEACSSGGGRVDLAVLARTDQVWISDNTDGSDRLLIQDGYTQIYPVRTMAAWVTDVPNQQSGRSVPLRFRFHSAMSGLLGLGGDLNEWSPEELKEAEGYVSEYKTIRHLVQHGVLHRLRAPQTHAVTAVQYSSADAGEAVVFGWLQQPRFGRPQPPLRLAALDPAARYREQRTGAVHHGATLLERGLDLPLPAGDWSSAVVHLVRV